jgi:hypothetical protein
MNGIERYTAVTDDTVLTQCRTSRTWSSPTRKPMAAPTAMSFPAVVSPF